MHSRPLGTSGRRVSEIGLGTMALATRGRPSDTDAVRLIHAAFDRGVDWLDTADSYCLDASDVGYGERLAARALAEWTGPKSNVLITTKGGFTRPDSNWVVDAHPARLKRTCEASLKALGTDSIFLYQLHAPDPQVYYPDSVGALVDLQREGKIQHIGLSNVSVPHLRAARRIARVVSVQNRANPLELYYFANGVVRYCEEHSIAFLAHGPLGGRGGTQRLEAIPELREVADHHNATPAQVALRWLLDRSPALLVIPGPSRMVTLESSIAASTLALTAADRALLATAFPPATAVQRFLMRAKRQGAYFRDTVRARAFRRMSH